MRSNVYIIGNTPKQPLSILNESLMLSALFWNLPAAVFVLFRVCYFPPKAMKPELSGIMKG